MELSQVIVLALVQGLTEFLPVSSSAHLVLVPVVVGWPDQGVAFDIAVHVGTLLAIFLYFRQELWRLSVAWLKSLIGPSGVDSRLAWQLIVATLPIAVVGFLAKDWVATLRSPVVIGWATLGFGLLLGLADKLGRHRQAGEIQMPLSTVFGIACAQIFALVPGASRSGVTLSAGLVLGLTRSAAARFSFYLSIPVIIAAALLELKEIKQEGVIIDWPLFLLGMGIAAASGLACIHLFLGWLERMGVGLFVVYRVFLGTGLIWYFS